MNLPRADGGGAQVLLQGIGRHWTEAGTGPTVASVALQVDWDLGDRHLDGWWASTMLKTNWNRPCNSLNVYPDSLQRVARLRIRKETLTTNISI
jgi:hypothetical protein